MMLKKKVDGLEEYYYQWMNKYKDDADRRGELLQRAYDALRMYTLSHGTPHTQFIDELADELGNPPDSNQPYRDALAKELADA